MTIRARSLKSSSVMVVEGSIVSLEQYSILVHARAGGQGVLLEHSTCTRSCTAFCEDALGTYE